MELKSAENEIDELRTIYESLRKRLVFVKSPNNGDDKDAQQQQQQQQLPELQLPINTTSTSSSVVTPSDPSNNTTTTDATSTGATAGEDGVQRGSDGTNARDMLRTLEMIRERVDTIQPKMTKFQKRLNDKDPITEKPRYGTNTYNRVQTLLLAYNELQNCIQIAFHGPSSPDAIDGGGGAAAVDALAVTIGAGENKSNAETSSALIESIRRQAEEEANGILRRQRLEEEARQREEDECKRQEEIRQIEQQRREEEIRLEEERQRAALVRQAEEAIAARERERIEADRIEREWYQSIRKGPDGVREQLAILVEDTAKDPSAQACALDALYTLFSQIAAHPENANFRRIRRDHPKFNQDIGRHRGGKEILIASGFVLGHIDDVPCYISKEPDVEKDLDGWSQWFDLLKATQTIIEEQLME